MSKEKPEDLGEGAPQLDFSQDAMSASASESIPTNTAIGEISLMAHRLMEIELELEELKLRQTELQREAWHLSTDNLPSKMLELGVSKFELDDGTKVSLGTGVSATWPKEGDEHEKAVVWMREQGYGDLIKDTVAVLFGRGEVDRADVLISLLDQGGFRNWSRKEEVHHMTLKAWLREMVEGGKEVPLDLFHAEVFTQAKLKLAKSDQG